MADKRKFLFLSGAGDGLGLGLYLKRKGHNVAVWIREKRARNNYNGLLQKLKVWDEYLDKETVVIFDSTGGGNTADRLQKMGYKVFGGSTFADHLEKDRGAAFELLKQVGVKMPHSETFYSWADGKAYAAKSDKRLVFKPSGKLAEGQNDNLLGSYVSYGAEDMAKMIDYFSTLTGDPPEFELQDFVEGGVAISTEGWFNGEKFITPFNHTVERKQLMNGNLGPSGGCSGNFVWKADRLNHIIEQGILKTEPLLQEYEYVGPIDLNTIVTQDGVYALEFTPRFGYDALPAFLELYNGDLGELIYSLASGEKPEQMSLHSGFASALRITIPPYPSNEFKPMGGVPVLGFTKEDKEHLFYYDVELKRDGSLVTTACYGVVVAVTALADTPSDTMTKVKALAEKSKIPEKQYRTDLGWELGKDYNEFLRLVQINHQTGKEREDAASSIVLTAT